MNLPIRNSAVIILASIFAFIVHISPEAAEIGSRFELVASAPSGIGLEFELIDLEFKPVVEPDGESVWEVGIAGVLNSAAPGLPNLPHITRLVVIPPNVDVNLNVYVRSQDVYRGRKPTLVKFDDPTQSGSTIYSATGRPLDGIFPSSPVSLGEPAIIRGVRVVPVTVHPVQFNSDHDELLVNKRVDIQLEFTAGNGAAPSIKPKPSRALGRMIREVVINPDDLVRDFEEGEGSVVYVIPNFEGVAEAIQPLVDWRRRQGYPVAVITVARNASNVDVRQALVNAYDNWEYPPEFITLVGDADLQNADFMIPTFDVGRAYMWETDYTYVLLEGQDLLPEAAIGRISARSVAELRNVVQKIIGYETDPIMDDVGWFRRAAVMANDPRTGYSSIYLQRWLRKMLLEVGFAEVDTFYFIHDNPVSGHDFVRDNINRGITIFNYRGWGQFNGDWAVGDVRELRNGRMLPVVMLPTCNTGDFADHNLASHAYSEDFLWAQNGGAVSAIGSSGFTHTNYNNVLDGGFLNGLFRDDLWWVGMALNKGKLELYRHFGLFNDVQDPQVNTLLAWEAHAYQFNVLGDAATEIWTEVPQRVRVAIADSLTVGQHKLEVRITDAESGEPVPNVRLTLLKEDELIRRAETDANGAVLFTFTPGELEPGELNLTASRHDLFPEFRDIRVVAPQLDFGFATVIVDDDRAGRSRGNGDNIPNPGEIIELRTYVKNFGDDRLPTGLSLTLTAVDGDVNVTAGEAELNNAPAPGDSAVVTFIVQVGTANWDGRRLAFNLDLQSDRQQWRSAMALECRAPALQYVTHRFTPSPFNAGDTAWVDVTLRNIGGIRSLPLNGRLHSGRQVVTVFNDRALFQPVSPDGNDSLTTARFRVYAHNLTVPGTPVMMTLNLADSIGFSDTVNFSYIIGQARPETPFGPDAYGYVCFDDTDTEWDVAPEYEWIEIDPALGGEGTDTEIQDQGNEQDFSLLVDLPFQFRYYGRDFRQITICSNGWFAFGDESKLADFQNRRIPPALGPRAQVCVFWDDLVNYVDEEDNQIGGIFYHYNEDENIFIIEWSRMRRYVGLDEDNNLRPGSEESFQVILYDPQHYPTYTGDGDIKMQYRQISNDEQVDPLEFDTPYATVGIVNLNGTDGMEYSFWNEYPAGAAPLANERAILFSTKLIIIVGFVQGGVTDLETGEPIEGAQVRGNRGSFAVTDRNGQFLMENVLIGEDYSFTAWAPGYNDSTLSGFDIAEGDTIELHFALRHPEFTLSRESVDVAVRPEFGTQQTILLSNSGNGPLIYRSFFDYPDEGQERWQRLLNFDVTAVTRDDRINGVDFFNGSLWVTGSNNRENPNLFYLFDTEGHFIRLIEQPSRSAYGFRGTTTDGFYLYGGEGDWIYGVNGNGEIVDSIPGPFDVQRAIAYDAETDHFWVADGRNNPLVEINRQGEILRTIQHELDIQGLGILPDDPDGHPLYILSRDKTNPALEIPYALVSKLNPVTGELRVVTVLEADVEDRAGGMEISNYFDPRKWVMLAVLTNSDGDKVSAYDLGPNTNWLTFQPRSGRLEAGSSETILLDISAAGLEEGEYALVINYQHNAAELSTRIPVTLTVDRNAAIEPFDAVPHQFGLGNAYPNPFNARTSVKINLDKTADIRLELYDISGRLVQVILEGRYTAGSHRVALNGDILAAGIYILRLTDGYRRDAGKLVLLK